MSSALLNLNIPPPLSDPIAKRKDWSKYPRPTDRDPQENLITDAWQQFISAKNAQTDAAAMRLHTVNLTGQSAAIAATDITSGTIAAGFYLFSYYARITQAAGVSSSLTVTLDFTEGGVTPSFSGAAMTGNTTTTVQTNLWAFQVTGLTPVRYSTAYASVGAPAMQYRLRAILSRIGT